MSTKFFVTIVINHGRKKIQSANDKVKPLAKIFSALPATLFLAWQ